MAKLSAHIDDDDILTITVFLHGTCSDDTDGIKNPQAYFDGELISVLKENVAGKEVDEEGVGSNLFNSKKHEPKDSHFYRLRKWFGQRFRKGDDSYFGFEQVAFGYGVEENIDDAVTQIKAIKEKFPGKKVRINMIGWSRGGATAHGLANALYADPTTQADDVNMFCVDPVPGFGRSSKANMQLKENVKKYVWVSAKNERSFGFSPVYPDVAPTTEFIPVVFPGHHATLVGNKGWRFSETEKMQGKIDLPEVGNVVRWLAAKFLTENGTQFKKDFKWQLKAHQLSDYFFRIKMKEEVGLFKKLENEVYTFKQFSAKFFSAARKVIVGFKNWFNQTFTDVPRINADLMKPRARYVNRLHQFLDENFDDHFSFKRFADFLQGKESVKTQPKIKTQEDFVLGRNPTNQTSITFFDKSKNLTSDRLVCLERSSTLIKKSAILI